MSRILKYIEKKKLYKLFDSISKVEKIYYEKIHPSLEKRNSFLKTKCYDCPTINNKNRTFPECYRIEINEYLNCYLHSLRDFIAETEKIPWITITFLPPDTRNEIENFNLGFNIINMQGFYNYFNNISFYSASKEVFVNHYSEVKEKFPNTNVFILEYSKKLQSVVLTDSFNKHDKMQFEIPEEQYKNYAKKMSTLSRKKLKYLYFVIYRSNNLSFQEDSFSGLYIPSKRKIPQDKLERISRLINIFLSPIEKIRRNLLLKDETENKISFAKKSAFAVLNARTTSHNTGSHILAHDLSKENPLDITVFNNYMRQRMLYNSDIASSSPSFDVTYTLGEIKAHFENIKIVTKYISGYDGKEFGNLVFKNENDKKFKIAVSNGILGLQAFFVIIENMIRNYFKHSDDSGNNLSKVFVTQKEYKYNIAGLNHIGEGEKLTVVANTREAAHLDLDICVEDISPDYIKIILSDGSFLDDVKRKRIQKFINDRILDDNNKLRPQGLGFLEMKGAVCYLNAIPLESLDEATIKINSEDLPAFSINGASENSLKYILYLRKPKEVLIIDDPSRYNVDQLNKIGVFVKNNIDVIHNERHRFLIVVNNELLNVVENNHASLPHRIFVVNLNVTSPEQNKYPQLTTADLGVIMNATKIEVIFSILYPQWVNHILEEKKVSKEKYFICTQWNKNKNSFQQILNNGNQLESRDFQTFTRENIIYFGDHDYYYNQTKDVFYYEGLFSLNHFTNLLNEFNKQPTFFLDQMFDLVFARVAIIDERIQSCFGDNQENEKLCKRNIFVPLISDLNLNKDTYDKTLEDKLTKWVQIQANDEKNNIDYLVIHLGIIEKFLSNYNIDKSSEEIKNWVEKVLTRQNKTSVKRIVITSERGTPENIPEEFNFVHFSNIHYNLIDVPSKFALVNILFSSRKRIML